jgi:hypothetical protein
MNVNSTDVHFYNLHFVNSGTAQTSGNITQSHQQKDDRDSRSRSRSGWQ